MLAEHTRKFVRRRLSVRCNRFLLCSASDEIVSVYAQPAHAIIFENYPKNQIKMQFSTINNQNFEKSSRILSNRRKFYQKNYFDTSQQKIGSPGAQSPRKCSNIEILAKIKGKESKFIEKVDQVHIRF
jgi:hypothetical protein